MNYIIAKSHLIVAKTLSFDVLDMVNDLHLGSKIQNFTKRLGGVDQ